MTIKKKPLIYLASPYTDASKKVVRARVSEIRALTARIINEQDAVIPFSPISFTHDLAPLVGEDFDWYEWDFQYLARCEGMIIVKQPGWETSLGIKKEMNFCMANSIPYAYAYPDEILRVCCELRSILFMYTNYTYPCRYV